MQDRRDIHDIMYQLDRASPDPAVMPEAYLGINMVKLDVASIRTNLFKGFRVETIRKKFRSNCEKTIGQTVVLREE